LSAAGLQDVRPGVYECRRGSDVIRVIVVAQLPQTEPNAMLHLFSGTLDAVDYGAAHYRRHSTDTSSLLEQLIVGYRGEGIAMPYTMADFRRDYILEHFPELTAEDQRRVLQKLPPEERLKDLLKDLSPEEIESYLKVLRAARPVPKRKPRRRR
jgi:hypothetical protein